MKVKPQTTLRKHLCLQQKLSKTEDVQQGEEAALQLCFGSGKLGEVVGCSTDQLLLRGVLQNCLLCFPIASQSSEQALEKGAHRILRVWCAL